MNILIPIAGQDTLFKPEDYAFPKPLIDIAGKPMIEHTIVALKNIYPKPKLTFVVQEELCRQYSLEGVLKLLAKGHEYRIVKLDAPTKGAVCSCLMAIEHIKPDEELVIVNSDQVIRSDLNIAIADFRKRELDTALLTFDSTHPRWSYVRTQDDGEVIEASEKKVISNLAIAGFYYFKKGSDFIEAAQSVLLNGMEVKGAYYISQVVNEVVLAGKKVSHYNIPASSYFNLYSPQKVSEYEEMLRRERIERGRINDRPVLLVPAAGEGSRFAKAGFRKPKPFIDVAGTPMIERVLENLKYKEMRTVIVARSSHLAQESEMVDWFDSNGIKLAHCDKLTEGTACTVLLAREHIDLDAPLIIANSDQIVDFDIEAFVRDCLDRGLDGSILCFKDSERNPKWSFAKTTANGLVEEVKEKEVISDMATVGIYLFTKGRYFIDAAMDMIVHNDRVNGEFYTCPAYNYAIKQGLKIGIYEVKEQAMHGIGTPEDLAAYTENVLKRKQA